MVALTLKVRGKQSTVQHFLSTLGREIADQTRRDLAKTRLVSEYVGDYRTLEN